MAAFVSPQFVLPALNKIPHTLINPPFDVIARGVKVP